MSLSLQCRGIKKKTSIQVYRVSYPFLGTILPGSNPRNLCSQQNLPWIPRMSSDRYFPCRCHILSVLAVSLSQHMSQFQNTFQLDFYARHGAHAKSRLIESIEIPPWVTQKQLEFWTEPLKWTTKNHKESEDKPDGEDIDRGIIYYETSQFPCRIFWMDSVIERRNPFVSISSCKPGCNNPGNRDCFVVWVEDKETMNRILHNKA